MEIVLTILGIGGLLGATILAALKWDAGGIWKYSPPIWGGVFGVILASVWNINGSVGPSFFEVILISFALGWFFWLCVWVEAKFGR